MIELFPEGFEEVERRDGVEFVAYTDSPGEERLWQVFGAGRSSAIREGWEQEWQRFHRPVRVGELWIGPSWEEPDADAVAVVIEPGRAFGTGAHPTTRLCLELLEDVPHGSLLDIGCGSGVLSIAAAKLGFGPVTSVDVEAAAIDAARVNAARNRIQLETRRLDALSVPLPAADVVVANVTLRAIEEIATKLDASYFVTSGYLDADRPVLAGWRHVLRRREEGWAADLHVRP